MKNTILFLLAVCSAFTGYCQHSAFSHVSLKTIHHREMLVFNVANEVNVRHYRIEASNDGQNFEPMVTVAAKGNSVQPVQYKYDLAGYSYTYYRVAKVEMNGNMPYSLVVKRKQTIENVKPLVPAVINTITINK